MTVYEALAAVMEDVRAVRKGDFNTQQSYSFRGVDAVVNAVGPALRAHGVIVTPTVKSVDYDIVHTTNNKTQTACRVLVDYVFHGPEGDSITATVIGEAWDSGDKAAPKAMSVAFRTALLQSLTLPTDEPDPDSQTYERSPAPVGEPVSPLSQARSSLADAWAEAGNPIDPEKIAAAYEEWAAQPFADAKPDDLLSFARVLRLPKEPEQEGLIPDET